MISLYKFATFIAAWPLRVLLCARALRGKEDYSRLGERRGLTSKIRPTGQLIWCHAASVGEALALLPLIERLLENPKLSILITTGTNTSARVLAERLPDRATHQFAPWDRRAWVGSFLSLWQPNVAIRMESELWPNTLFALRDQEIPTVIVNARLSESTVRGWRRFPVTAQRIMASLTLVLAQTEEHAARYKAIGARSVRVTGNIKLAAPALPVSLPDADYLRAMIDKRPVWLAASTHPGEEGIAFATHKEIANQTPDLLTIIAPRHPSRGKKIAGLGKASGLETATRSLGQPINSSTDIYIVDTIGELGTMFSVCPIVFVGKSLASTGGQNPVEPSHFNCAILFGPDMENFQNIADKMTAHKMALQVCGPKGLTRTVATLLEDKTARETLASAANGIFSDGEESLTLTTGAIIDLITNPSRLTPPP